MECVPLSVGCIPREQSCLGTQALWGTRVLNIYSIVCNLHTIKAFFPSCPPFHLFFSPLINLLSYKQENQNLKQALLLLLLLAGNKMLSITKQKDISGTLFLTCSVQCPGFFFPMDSVLVFPLTVCNKMGK